MRKSLLILAAAMAMTMVLSPAAHAACANGVCGLEPEKNAAQEQPRMPMAGMQQGAGQGGMNMQGMQGMMMGGCPMMKQMAALQERVRMMEDMMGMHQKQ